jgi:hypothetical protein
MATSKLTVTSEVMDTQWCGGETFRAVRVIWAGERTLARVEPDGTVLVLDQIAKCYTRRHPMSARQVSRVRALVSES